jgi:hypothetical protein
MNERPLLELPPLPPGIPHRSIRHDDRFDVVETLEVVHAPPGAPAKPQLISSVDGPIRHIMLWYPAGTPSDSGYRDILSRRGK